MAVLAIVRATRIQKRLFANVSRSGAFGIAALFLATTLVRAAETSLEFAVKAAYLYKFAPFVTWPASLPAKNAFDLCLSGSDEVTRMTPEFVAGQTINGKPIAIRNLAGGDAPDGCQILYVANAPGAGLLLDSVRNKPILTVADSALHGHSVIEFAMVEHHVRFNIDNGLATAAGLSISSKLLSLANAVTPLAGGVR